MEDSELAGNFVCCNVFLSDVWKKIDHVEFTETLLAILFAGEDNEMAHKKLRIDLYNFICSQFNSFEQQAKVDLRKLAGNKYKRV